MRARIATLSAWPYLAPLVVTIVCGWPGILNAQAAPKIDVELATESGFPATASQQWFRLLTELRVDNLQIRGSRADDAAAIEVAGSQSNPVYKVKGILTAKNELQLPGAKFSVRDRARLSAWLNHLREEGPERVQGGKPLPFGLPAKQLADVHEDLTREVNFATQGARLRETLAKIGKELTIPLVIQREAVAAVDAAEPITEQVQGISAGTALAYLLRHEGLVLEPRLGKGRRLELVVKASHQGEPCWPVGWPIEKPREILPDMFEQLNVEIDDIPLSQALAAIGERLETPILLDHYALARQGIDPAKVKVTLPPDKLVYAIILRKLLHQAKLTYEVRMDEAAKPLLWITTVKRVKMALDP